MNDLRLKSDLFCGQSSEINIYPATESNYIPDLKNRICYGLMVSYETYEQKNTLEHKIVTRGRKIDMLNSFTI